MGADNVDGNTNDTDQMDTVDIDLVRHVRMETTLPKASYHTIVNFSLYNFESVDYYF
jgi:hypothetical protein